MKTRRTLKLALAVVAALLAAGTTFAWAGVLVGGHRADRIGTFEPVAHLVPAGPQGTPTAPAQSERTPTSPSLATTSRGETTKPEVSATNGRPSDNPSSSTTDDNGRSNDD